MLECPSSPNLDEFTVGWECRASGTDFFAKGNTKLKAKFNNPHLFMFYFHSSKFFMVGDRNQLEFIFYYFSYSATIEDKAKVQVQPSPRERYNLDWVVGLVHFVLWVGFEDPNGSDGRITLKYMFRKVTI